MTIHVNRLGNYSVADIVYANDNGTWKEAHEVYIKVAGSWVLQHKNVTISANTADLNLATLAYNTTTPIKMTVTINSGVYVYASVPSTGAGPTAALTVGALNANSNITIVNNGFIYGAGGAGGQGGKYSTQGVGNGGDGGNAIVTTIPITIRNNGTIAGGGGGGGGGGSTSYT